MTTFSLSTWLGVLSLSWIACSPTPDEGLPPAAHPSALAAGRGRFIEAPAPAQLRFTKRGRGADRITAVVKLAGEPLTIVQGARPERRLSSAEKGQLRAELQARQAPMRTAIAALGGEVLGAYQSAYNGLKVRIPTGELARLRSLPGVVAVHPVRIIHRDNTNGVPMVGSPQVWAGALGVRGEGVRIGILDTGIDYTHASFGGPGTAAAFAAAKATSTTAAAAALFGPAAPKIKGGIDLVGDDYDANGTGAALTPQPDPNPLDCYGHGTHVAATAAGFGVLDTGARYDGPYDDTTFVGRTFRVGPGVAPRADLYAIRVFGCVGETSSDILVDAIEWAVDHNLDVINMSLGYSFGGQDAPEAEAVDNAAAAGVITVASAGNSGAAPYLAGAPASAQRAISVAAVDPVQTLQAAVITVDAGKAVTALNANGATLTSTPLPIKVLRNPDGSISLGCDPKEYAGSTGALVVVQRGTCARVARAIFGQKAGAAAVAMINNAPGLPPYEGLITRNPDTSEDYTVTIPFLGVRGAPSSDGADVSAGTTAALSAVAMTNPGYRQFASFTSAGPRFGDSWLKPDVSAPGVSIMSAGMGMGANGTVMSGTSMAAPHATGVAALTRQAHPSWSADAIKLAIVNTADPAQVAAYRTSVGGSGLVSAPAAARTQVVAAGDRFTGTLNFGFEELGRDLSRHKPVRIANHGTRDVTFQVAATLPQGAPHSVTLGTSLLTVKAHGSATLDVQLTVPAATVLDSSEFREVAGLIALTPMAAGNGGVELRVPYYLVPRALSNIRTQLTGALSAKHRSAAATITNYGGAIAGTADFYAWGLEDASEGLAWNDLRAVGVQSIADPSASDPDRRLLVFAVNTWRRWSSACISEFELLLDLNDDGKEDYLVVGADQGMLTSGSENGVLAAAVFNVASGKGAVRFLASAPTDGTTALLPIYSSDLCQPPSPCLSTAQPRFSYRAQSASDDARDDMPGYARFNAWSSAISQGQFATVPSDGATTAAIAVEPTEWSLTPPKGLMIVSPDNRSGSEEAQLLRLTVR